jgi:translation initiation factor IF-2
VIEGKVLNGAKFRAYRPSAEERDEDGNLIHFTTGTVSSLQKEQESVKEAKEGHECGMKAKVRNKIEVGDILEYYIME